MMTPFAGVTVAAITPHGKRGDEPDIAATLDLLDFLCAAGVQGLALQSARQHPVTLLMGHEKLFARARASGADGVISGIACAVPEVVLALDQAVQQGDREGIARQDARLQQFLAAIEPFPFPIALK